MQRRVLLNAEQEAEAWVALRADSVAMCRFEIIKRLFVGLVASRGGEPMKPDDAFDTYLGNYMNAFGRGAFDAIWALGVVPIAMGRVRGVGMGAQELVPFVPRPGTYALSLWADNGVPQYGFHWLDNGAAAAAGVAPAGVELVPDAHVYVAHDFGFDPTFTGQLTSLMHTLAPVLVLMDEMTEHALDAEAVACAPPMLLAHAPARDATKDTDLESGVYAGVGSCAAHANAVYTRDAEQRAVLAAQIRDVAASHGLEPDSYFGVRRRALRGAPARVRRAGATDARGNVTSWTSQLTLPEGTEVMHQVMPHARADFVPIMTHALERVAGVLGVPRSLFTGSSAVRAGAENAEADIQGTVRYWADTLSRLMTHAYYVTRGTDTFARELGARIERVRARRGVGDADAVAAAAPVADLISAAETSRMSRRAADVRITFDLPPAASLSTLTFLYGIGVLKPAAYAREAARSAGLDASQIDVVDLSKAERRALALEPLKDAVDAAPGARGAIKEGGRKKRKETT